MTSAFNGVTGWFIPGVLSAERRDAGSARITTGRLLSPRMPATFTHGVRALHMTALPHGCGEY